MLEKDRFTECKRDLGVLVSSDGTWHEQVNSAATKANWVLGLTKNTFSSLSDKIARIIYPTFVQPHLECASSVWNPHQEYNSKTLESVQRRASLTKESHNLPYEKRLERLGLTDLKTRREKVNYCDESKILRPHQKITVRSQRFQLSRERTS